MRFALLVIVCLLAFGTAAYATSYVLWSQGGETTIPELQEVKTTPTK